MLKKDAKKFQMIKKIIIKINFIQSISLSFQFLDIS
jgi:hypothetical protein